MKITEHAPSFVSLETGTNVQDFNTLEELLEIPFVKKWSTEKNFYRFSLADYALNFQLLVAEFNDGKRWFIVGFIENCNIDLPQWKPIE
jgi:hypothetical protein